jgi:outer membrane protein
LAERARLRATDEAVAQANSGWRPTVTVNGSGGWSKTETEIAALAPVQDQDRSWSGQVTATQPIFQGGQTIASIRQAKAIVRSGRAALTSAEQTALFDAVTAYMDTVRDEAVLNLTRNNVNVLQRQLQAARDRFEVGEITRTDVAQAEARLSLAQSQFIASEAALTVSRSAYERVIGHPPTKLEERPKLPGIPKDEEEALSVARADNPALNTQREAEIASKYAVDFARRFAAKGQPPGPIRPGRGLQCTRQ